METTNQPESQEELELREHLDGSEEAPAPDTKPQAAANQVQQIVYHVYYKPDADGKRRSECFLEIPDSGTKIVIPYYKIWFVTIMGEEIEIERVIKPYKDMVKKIKELKQRFAEYVKERTLNLTNKPTGEPSETTNEQQAHPAGSTEASEAETTATAQGEAERQKVD